MIEQSGSLYVDHEKGVPEAFNKRRGRSCKSKPDGCANARTMDMGALPHEPRSDGIAGPAAAWTSIITQFICQ